MKLYEQFMKNMKRTQMSDWCIEFREAGQTSQISNTLENLHFCAYKQIDEFISHYKPISVLDLSILLETSLGN